MKKINKNELKILKEEYLQNDLHKGLRSALSKTNLHDVIYLSEAEKNQNFHFSLNLDTLPVNNQKRSGRCWIFAGLNVLREVAAKKYHVANIEFSQTYLAFYDKLEKTNYFIEAMDDFLGVDNDDRKLKHLLKMGIQDGGQWDMFVSLINKYGIVIKEAMPETFQSSNTMLTNQIINFQLRKYVSEARELFEKKESAKIKTLKADYFKKLYQLLVSAYGVPPTSFDYEYVDKDKNYQLLNNLDPIKFYQDLKIDLNDYISVINAPTKDKPYFKNYTVEYLGNVVSGKEINHLNLPMERLIELTIKQLKDKEVVWFGSDVFFYGDREKGIWDDKQLDYSLLGIDYNMSKENRLNYVQGAMNHAMIITGVNLKDEQPNKWKIANSWGDDKGSKGYYLISQSWFLEHVYQVIINKKHLTESELKAYNSKPTVLKPWDPMGSLA